MLHVCIEWRKPLACTAICLPSGTKKILTEKESERVVAWCLWIRGDHLSSPTCFFVYWFVSAIQINLLLSLSSTMRIISIRDTKDTLVIFKRWYPCFRNTVWISGGRNNIISKNVYMVVSDQKHIRYCIFLALQIKKKGCWSSQNRFVVILIKMHGFIRLARETKEILILRILRSVSFKKF